MKRVLIVSLVLTMLFVVCFSSVSAESGGINPVESGSDYKGKYEDMITTFEDGDYKAAWESAKIVYEADSNYMNIFRYYSYLRARVELLPQKKYQEAYYLFSLLAGQKQVFADSDGYALYAQGLQYEADGDLEKARACMLEAFDLGVNEAASHISITPVSNKTIEISLTNSTATSLQVSWIDESGNGPYRVTYSPSGISSLTESKQVVNDKKLTLRNLLPDTQYAVTVTKENAPSNFVTEVFSTNSPEKVDYGKAHSIRISFYQLDRATVKKLGISGTVNNKQDKTIKLVEDGFKRGNRKPSDESYDFYARIHYSSDSENKLNKDTKAQFTYILRSSTSPTVSVGKVQEIILQKDTLNQSFYTECLTDLMDLLYENGGFDGEYFSIDVYIDNEYLGSQDIVIRQR